MTCSAANVAIPRHGLRLLLRRLCGEGRELLVPNLCPACGVRLSAELGEPCAECLAGWRPHAEPRCPGCGGHLDNALKFCGECLRMEEARPWDLAVSAAPFAGGIRDQIHRFKYQGATALARPFGRRMREAWERFGGAPPDAVVPVPLHWWRELRRGYNQAELLAREIAAPWGVPVENLLRRRRWTRQQARLPFHARQKNLQGVCAPRGPEAAAGRHLLLVDDVMTTGATLAAATETLRRAGAQQISVLTIARG